MAQPQMNYSGSSAATFVAGASFAIPAARVGIPAAAAAGAGVTAAVFIGAAIAGAAAAYALQKYLEKRRREAALAAIWPADMPIYVMPMNAAWVLQCGTTGGQYGNGYPNGCPIDPNQLVVTGSGMPVTGPAYNNILHEWVYRTWNDKPGFPSSQTTPDTITRIENVGYWTAALSASEDPGTPVDKYGQVPFSADPFRASTNIEDRRRDLDGYLYWGQMAWNNLPDFIDWYYDRKAQIDEWLSSPQFPYDLVPARDRFQAAVPATSEATSRSYAPPRVDSASVPVARPDAYAANPGLAFVWQWAPARPAAPAVPVLPGTVVRPTPGTVTQTVVAPVLAPSNPAWRAPPLPARPDKNTKEKKGRMTIAGAAASVPGGSQALRLFNFATEFCDAVEALWDAIPFEQRLKNGWVKKLPKGKQGLQKWSKPGCLKMAAQLNEGWKDMHLPTAVKNLIQEHLEDMAIGKLAQKATKAHSAAQRRIGARGTSPLLGPTL